MVKRKKDKGTNKDLQNTTQKTAERATQTPLKSGDGLMCCRSVKDSISGHTRSINFWL